MKWLINSWYQPQPIRWLLSPLSALYRCIISIRHYGYRSGLLTQTSLAVPVIIVGNISVGGTGKTPTVIWLAKQLQQAGFRPGIISRGYGGQSEYYPLEVKSDSQASQVGDEPLLIHRQTACPMVVGPDRVAAGKMLLNTTDCNIVISDDGLQHYALQRDIEIVVVDSQRLFGNEYCLPAGPLREPLSRLHCVDFIIHNGGHESAQFTMSLIQGDAINLCDPKLSKSLASFQQQKLHAIAGIGNPQRFFQQLVGHGLTIESHAFADHHAFNADDLQFNDDQPILMTEKDAVKCQQFANKNMWYIPINAAISGKLSQKLLHTLAGLTSHG